jgi:uncharacterized membrane protein
LLHGTLVEIPLGMNNGAYMKKITTYLVLVFLTTVSANLATAENEPLLAANTAPTTEVAIENTAPRSAANEVATENNSTAQQTPAEADVVRFEQVLGILSTSCFRCHSEAGGNRAGVNLETYENVFANREGIQMHIEAGTMPPIRPLRLNDEQQRLVLNWLQQGARP